LDRPTKRAGAAVYIGIAVLALLGGCRNAAANGMQSGESHIEQSPEAGGVIYGRLLAGSGAPSRETAEPVGVSGQEIAVVDPSSGNMVARAVTGVDGSFRLSVAPGTYLIHGGGKRQYVRVGAGEKAKVNLMLPTP
jgi:hypothetical protein